MLGVFPHLVTRRALSGGDSYGHRVVVFGTDVADLTGGHNVRIRIVGQARRGDGQMKVSRNSLRAITMVLALTALPAFAIGGGATSTVRAADVVVRPAVTPAVFAGDVRSLPTERRWQPGDPVRVVPEGTAERRPSGPPPSVPRHADPVRQASSG